MKADLLYRMEKEKLDVINASFGEHAEAYAAMKSCLAWNTIYENEHDRVCSPVSRRWSVNWGGYILFDWDTYFAAIMASVENKELAQLNAIAITNEATEKGFIPNLSAANNLKTRDRTEPPVGAFSCLEVYKRWPEAWFCEAVFPNLLSWNRWFAAHRMTEEGYLCWGTDPYEPINGAACESYAVDSHAGAALESGMDNSLCLMTWNMTARSI